MSSLFSFSRPRHIPGNYIVTVVLELQPTETGYVNVSRARANNCGFCGKQEPVRKLAPSAQRGRQEMYRIENIVAGDDIYILPKLMPKSLPNFF